MKCAHVSVELIPYQLGELVTSTRESVEQHLLTCGDCLRTFFALKRSFEAGTCDVGASEFTRARVRASVAALAKPGPASRWERPVAIAAAVLLVLGTFWGAQMLGQIGDGP